MRFRMKRGMKGETGNERPVDECEVRCLNEMKARLKELGACQREWDSWKRAGAPFPKESAS